MTDRLNILMNDVMKSKTIIENLIGIDSVLNSEWIKKKLGTRFFVGEVVQ